MFFFCVVVFDPEVEYWQKDVQRSRPHFTARERSWGDAHLRGQMIYSESRSVDSHRSVSSRSSSRFYRPSLSINHNYGSVSQARTLFVFFSLVLYDC